jgi:CIC family chloride channel protein
MTAFFAAVVRAPVTGMVLIIEMTATTSLLIPMLAACVASMGVATALGNEPIYDTLRRRIPGLDRSEEKPCPRGLRDRMLRMTHGLKVWTPSTAWAPSGMP